MTLKKFFLLLCLVVCNPGCRNEFQSVTGVVEYPDGKPMTEGMVIAEMNDGKNPVMIQGEIGGDGKFVLGTDRPGDGAKVGTYQVLITARERREGEAEFNPYPIDGKFRSYATSGLKMEVKPGKNEFKFTVSRPKDSK